jgi:4-amino-4-deoxy-L-arabinose transferase-like glycosyltransferase
VTQAAWRRTLVALLALGLALRLLGLGWGLPGQLSPGDPPFHPDEHEAFVAAETLYASPPAASFNKGGALYVRLAWIARAAARAWLGSAPPGEYAATLVLLRGLNAVLALASALLAARLGRQVGGPQVGLGAAALLLCFPGSVLDAHYARPDITSAFFSTAALACAGAVARDGGLRWLALGGACAGLATATLLSGAVGLAPLALGAFEWQRRSAGGRWLRAWARSLVPICAGALAGWLAGNLEALLHPQAWLGGLEIASSTHGAGGWSPPLRQLGRVSLYAFGSVAAVAAYLGIPVLLRSRAPGSLAIVAHLLCGYVLLGRVGFDMMRHLEFVAAPTAIAAAAALAAGTRRLARSPAQAVRAATAALALAAVLSFQLSLAYVWPMQFGEDARTRAGTWLARNAPPGASVGVTTSFYGDETYVPRFPAGHALHTARLMLRRNHDASGYLDLGLDYIATTDFARDRASGLTAPGFFEALFSGQRYRLAAVLGPGPDPLCLPDWLGSQRPGDLLYVRSTFYVFERRS